MTKLGRKIYEWTFSIKVRQSKAQSLNGAQAESLIEARLSEDHEMTIATPTVLLDQVSACLTHSTFFREKREEFYNVQPKAAKNTTTYLMLNLVSNLVTEVKKDGTPMS